MSSLIALFCVYEAELSGYGVTLKLKDWRIGEYLAVSPATIYRAMGKMEDGGLLTSRVQQNGRYPSSRLYCITPKGKKRYQKLVAELGKFDRSSRPLTVILSLGTFLSKPRRIALARAWSRDAKAARDKLEEQLNDPVWGHTYGKAFAEWLLLDNQIARLTCDIEWVDKYIRLIEAGKA